MLKVETAGLPIPAKDIISEAIEKSFGSGVVAMEDLSKENLRHKVRLSRRDLEVVLVVLDGVSTDLCKDIENGLYSSDKFHTYTSDRELVSFLNSKFGLNMELPEEQENTVSLSEETSGLDMDLVEQYESRIANKNLEIESLTARIQELQGIIEGDSSYTEPQPEVPTVSQEEYDSLKKENFSLRDSILSIENESKKKSEEISSLEAKVAELSKSVTDLEKSKKSLLVDYKSVNTELTDLRVTYSKQSGVLMAKESELSVLQKKLSTVDDLQNQVDYLKEEHERLENESASLAQKSSDLKVDLDSKIKEISRLQEELRKSGATNELLEKVKRELQEVTADRDRLLKESSSLTSQHEKDSKSLESQSAELDSLKGRLVELQGRIAKNDEDLTTLNSEKLKLQGEIRTLRQTVSGDTNIEEVIAELANARKQYDSLKMNVFNRVSSFAMPNGTVPVSLINRKCVYRNIRFVFSGSTESRKGTYKCLLDEFKKLPQSEKVLIVDAVSETAVDYVFEMSRVETSIDWFRKGGGVQPYLSDTCLKNVRVLSPGLGYVNDSYFLTVNWDERLSELENSGYKVIIFCGDISNIVGRVLHESFADLGDSYIYVHGNAISSRNLISNLRGLTNSGKSIVAYFDFNAKMERFYKIVQRTNECRILSVIRSK